MRRTDRGFSLVELLIVVVVLGIVASVATLSVRGLTDEGEGGVCDADQQTVSAAVEVYLGSRDADSVPGADAAARMQELVDAGLLRTPSTHWLVAADGSLTPVPPCAA